MSLDLDTSPTRTTAPRRPRTVIALAVLLGLLAIGSLQGGVAMVLDPVAPLGMTADYLERTPIDTYVWPGVFLLAIGVACVITVAGLIFDWRWDWAGEIERSVGHRWPWIGAVSIGGVLLVFEVLEVYLIPFHPVMHPLLIATSVAVLLLATARSTRENLRSD